MSQERATALCAGVPAPLSRDDAGLPFRGPNSTAIMLKPVGALCNLDCTYCYYLPTKEVYDGREHRMSLETLESVFASVLPTFGDHVTVVWQGGEPTLAGLPFFRRAMEFQELYRRPDQVVSNCLQTNCTLLNNEWCTFLKAHSFLVGASIDGTPEMHDRYRLDNRGRATSADVERGIAKLQEHAVEYNLMCVLNDRNVLEPDALWKYLTSLGTPWLQFIPAIEWEPDPSHPGRNRLAPYAPSVEAYGRFLCAVFDRWFDKHRDKISVRFFDAVLNKLVLDTMTFCILDGVCDTQMTIEHDGSVFGCDHFVEPRWRIGKIGDATWTNNVAIDGGAHVALTVHGGGIVKRDTHSGRDIASEQDVSISSGDAAAVDDRWLTRLDADRLNTFAQRKQNLPDGCVACQYRELCHGGCPKHRASGGDAPEPTVLCEAYKMFYRHALPRMNWLASFLKRDELPPPPGAAKRRR